MDATPELAGVMQVAIPAKDIDRASDFYARKLGMQFLFKAPNMAFLACGDTRIYLDSHPGMGVQPGGNTLLYFRAVDIERAHSTFKERGVEVTEAPHVIARMPDRDVWLMWIRDSESNLVGVMQEKKKA